MSHRIVPSTELRLGKSYVLAASRLFHSLQNKVGIDRVSHVAHVPAVGVVRRVAVFGLNQESNCVPSRCGKYQLIQGWWRVLWTSGRLQQGLLGTWLELRPSRLLVALLVHVVDIESTTSLVTAGKSRRRRKRPSYEKGQKVARMHSPLTNFRNSPCYFKPRICLRLSLSLHPKNVSKPTTEPVPKPEHEPKPKLESEPKPRPKRLSKPKICD